MKEAWNKFKETALKRWWMVVFLFLIVAIVASILLGAL